MKRTRKYKTEEERKIANAKRAKQWYLDHKNDQEFLTRRKLYQVRYYNHLDAIKKEMMKSYNTDYVFYVRNIVTGKFEKKIARTREKYNELAAKINNMETKKQYLIGKFGHIKIDKWEKKNKGDADNAQ